MNIYRYAVMSCRLYICVCAGEGKPFRNSRADRARQFAMRRSPRIGWNLNLIQLFAEIASPAKPRYHLSTDGKSPSRRC